MTKKGSQVPLPGCYVKVYAQLKDSSERFYKDGYTDIFGRFDYGALNSQEWPLHSLHKLSLFVKTPTLGSQILEVSPPVD